MKQQQTTTVVGGVLLTFLGLFFLFSFWKQSPVLEGSKNASQPPHSAQQGPDRPLKVAEVFDINNLKSITFQKVETVVTHARTGQKRNTKYWISLPPYVPLWDANAHAQGYGNLLSPFPASRCVVVDVGANIGLVTLAYASLGYRVMAFEPVPANLVYLKQSILANGFTDVKVFQGAVGEKPGRTTIHVPEGREDNTSLNPETAVKNVGGKSVAIPTEIFSLDAVAEMYPEWASQICFIKIDVQGFETGVLKGARNLLQKADSRLMIQAEYDLGLLKTAGQDPDEMFKYMLSLGFKVYTDSTTTKEVPDLTKNIPYDVYFRKPEHGH